MALSAFLVLFATFFFLRDGGRIWRFLVGLLLSPKGRGRSMLVRRVAVISIG
jgi:predicted PurR-regulated permease PerM